MEQVNSELPYIIWGNFRVLLGKICRVVNNNTAEHH